MISQLHPEKLFPKSFLEGFFDQGFAVHFGRLIEAEDLDVDVQVDGGINDETMETVLTAGANLLVAGSYVFNDDLAKNVKHARERMDEIIRRID